MVVIIMNATIIVIAQSRFECAINETITLKPTIMWPIDNAIEFSTYSETGLSGPSVVLKVLDEPCD